MDPTVKYLLLPLVVQLVAVGLILRFLEGRGRVAALVATFGLWAAGFGWFRYQQNYQPDGYDLSEYLAGVNYPTGAIFLPDGRMLVTEKAGIIRVAAAPDAPKVRDTPFVDLSDRVSSSTSEEGLLSLALHPDFGSNRVIYAYYTAEEGAVSRLVRYQVDAALQRIEVDSEQIVLEIDQPNTHHNGGQLLFGPDGMLYLSLGEGGTTSPSPSQDRSNLLGSLLRLDVSDPFVRGGYQVPADNPFVGQEGIRPEIFAYGLRNPWRYDFADDGAFWVGDVGRDKLEEIDWVPAGELSGANFGWDHFEASLALTDHDPQGLVFPVYEYTHLGLGGCSVIGGKVYRGATFPDLRGQFLFADFCNGTVSALRPTEQGFEPERILKLQGQLTSFAQDAAGEIYMVIINSDSIWKVVPDHDSD